MADIFPENEVEVTPQYLTIPRGELPSQTITKTRDAVVNVIVDSPIQSHHPGTGAAINRAVIQRNNARRRLRDLLNANNPNENFGNTLDRIESTYTALAGHAFETAEQNRNNINVLSVSNMTVPEIQDALGTDNMGYAEYFLLAPGEWERNDYILPGYNGPTLDANQLVLCREVVTGGPEIQFRKALLQAEIKLGQRKFTEAAALYENLRAAAAPGSPRRKFLALRAAFAYAGRGDSIFRRSRINVDGLPEAVQAYNSAIRVVNENQISLQNFLAGDVVNYANQQKAKIERGLNYLGFTDGHVPLETVEFLSARTSAHVNLARDTGSAYERFLEKALHLQDVDAELQSEIATADVRLVLAAEEIKNADDHIAEIDEALASIADKKSFLAAQEGLFFVETLAKAVVATIGGGGVSGLALLESDGPIGQIINFAARSNDLDHQETSAGIQRSIAVRSKTIKTLERDIIKLRRDFLENKRVATQGRDLNKDLYYKLANICAQLTERHIESAIRHAYLLERAVSFKYHRPNLSILPNFDFSNDAENIIVGGLKLASIVADIDDRATPPSAMDSVQLEISLKARYPVEFSRFQQSGKMGFAISLYDLDKVTPGTYDRRITAFAVKPIGLVPATGYTGLLIHPGTFVERDRDSTLAASTTRFVPTPERLAAVFAALQEGKVPGTPVDGIVPCQLDQDVKHLSKQTETLAAHGITDPSTTKLFERYGAATVWTIELNGLDPRKITDIRFELQLETFETDLALRTTVKDLIKKYEAELVQGQNVDTALDRVLAISVRDLFEDAFLGMETGESSFVIDDTSSLFRFGLTDIKVKAVVAQAINFNQQGATGVHLKIHRGDGPFVLDKVTVANGLTEDPNSKIPTLEPSDRFSPFGTWKIELPEPAQFGQVFKQGTKEGDLIIFLVYEFKEN